MTTKAATLFLVFLSLFPHAGLAQPWQTNQPAASLMLNGQGSSALSPLRLTQCAADPLLLTLQSSQPGSPWDLIFNFAPAVPFPQGGIWVPGNQIINVDLFQPFHFLNQQAWTVPVPPMVSIPVAFPTSLPAMTAQMVVVDPTSPAGVALSAAGQVQVVSPTARGVIGPDGDDSVAIIRFTSCPLNLAPFPLFGVTYDELRVSSNGRVLFGGGDEDGSPTPGEALTGQPFVGAWCDLDPSLGGAIGAFSPRPGALRVEYRNVPYKGYPTTANSFAITLDTTNGGIALSGLTGLEAHPGSAPMMLGLSAGNLGATDPGSGTFTSTGPHLGATNLGMIYEFGPAGTLANGLSSISFLPGQGNYQWTGSTSGIPDEFTWSGAQLVDHITSTVDRITLTPPTRAALQLPLDGSRVAIQSGDGIGAIAQLNQFMSLVVANQAEINAGFAFPSPPPGQTLPFNSATEWLLQMPTYLAGQGPNQITQPVVASASSSRWDCAMECWDAFVDCMGNPSYSWWDFVLCGVECLPALAGSPLGFALCYLGCVGLGYTDDCLLSFVTCLTNC